MTRRSLETSRVSKPCPMGDQFQAKAGCCTVCDRDLLEISAMTSEEVEAALSEPQTPCLRQVARDGHEVAESRTSVACATFP